MVAKLLGFGWHPTEGNGAFIRANPGSSWLFPARLDWPVVDSRYQPEQDVQWTLCTDPYMGPNKLGPELPDFSADIPVRLGRTRSRRGWGSAPRARADGSQRLPIVFDSLDTGSSRTFQAELRPRYGLAGTWCGPETNTPPSTGREAATPAWCASLDLPGRMSLSASLYEGAAIASGSGVQRCRLRALGIVMEGGGGGF